MTTLRPELKELPERISRLPLDKRGYPTPCFVETMPDGSRDFRFMSPAHWTHCVKHKVCWVCGEALGSYLAFVIGPMCAINRTSSEPPSHRECALWSARFCPFLSRPHMVRREDELTREMQENVAGCPILRNPGVTLVWITRSYKVWKDPSGKPLIEIGDPLEALWFAEGRRALRAEIQESIATGLPVLEELAREDGGMEELRRRQAETMRLLPAYDGISNVLDENGLEGT